jgi:hypothetical protein
LEIQADDLAGFPCGNLRLAQQKGQVHALLPERGAVRGFFKGGIDQGAGFLEATGFKEFVSSSRLGVTGAGAGGKKEQRQKEKDESSYHSFTFTFTFTKKKEGTTLGRRGLRLYRD